MRVRLVPAKQELVHRRVQATGSLFALDESIVSSQVDGQIERIWVDVGDTVKEGQPLVTIDPRELQYDLDNQRAAVREVRAQLGIGPKDPPPEDPSKVAFVQRAAADLQDAQQKYERAKQLAGAQLIPKESLDEAEARYKSAVAAHTLAIQQVEQLAAQLQSSESRVRLAEKKLADAVIRAPFSGAVKERRVNPGEFLRVQSPVMVLVHTSELRARLDVPAKWAGAVHTGATVDIQVDAYPGEVFHGKLTRINPSVSPDSRTFQVEALVSNPDMKLKPGFFVQASLPSEIQEKSIRVPGDAIVYSYGTYKVYVADGQRLRERPVKLGAETETSQGVQTEIAEGLQGGERVAVAPAGTTLYDGAIIADQGR